MKLPEPKPGSVIRYSYLWFDERRRGAMEGRKDRPAMILAVAVVKTGGETEVLALAITHARPRSPEQAVEIPATICRQLGLDDERAFVVTTEANIFVWPGPDIRAVPGRATTTPFYGQMPRSTLRDIARSYLANHKRERRLVGRDT